MAKNKVVFGDTTIMDITDTTAEAADVANGKVFYCNDGVRTVGTGNYGDATLTVTGDHKGAVIGSVLDLSTDVTIDATMLPEADYYGIEIQNSGGKTIINTPTKAFVDAALDAKADTTDIPTMTSELTNDGDGTNNFVTFGDEATSSEYGVIKTNPNQNIDLNADGQLEVGGRIGQFEGTTGLFAPNNREPRAVGDNSLLITDALGMSIGGRAFADVSGYSITVRSAAPGTTVYYVENTYLNRIIAKTCENGFVSKDEATSKVEMTIPVVSVLINGQTFTPNSSPDDPNNPIVITLESSANPETTITQLRMFGVMKSYASAHIGNGIHSEGGGRHLLVGGAISKYGSSNDNCLVGMQIFSSGNGNAVFGRNHIAVKNRGFLAGTGHDTTNARTEGASAVGEYSLMDSSTLFAVGNGTSATNRSNAFEVTTTKTKIDNIVATAKQIVFDGGDYDNLAPALVAGNWGTNTNWSFADEVLTFNGVSSALNCSAKNTMPVTVGETLAVSFEAKKALADGSIGNLNLNLLKTNATGGGATNNIVINKPSSDITTEWATYTATFTVPSGMEYMLPRITKSSGTVTSGQNYQVRNLLVGRPMDKGVIMTSPNGTKYKLTVDDSGNLSTTAVV